MRTIRSDRSGIPRVAAVLMAVLLVIGTLWVLPAMGQTRGSSTTPGYAAGSPYGLGGTVYDSFDNAVLSGVHVDAVNQSDDMSVGTADTDVNGGWTITAADNGFYNITFTLNDYTKYTVVNVEGKAGQTGSFDVSIDPVPSHVTGKVTDAETGEPIMGVKVDLFGDSMDYVDAYFTGSNGMYEFWAMNRTVSVHADTEGYGSDTVIGIPIGINGSYDHDFQLDRDMVTFEGQVLDSEMMGIEGVEIIGKGDVDMFETGTNGTGHFSVDVMWGEFDLYYFTSGFYMATESVSIGMYGLSGHSMMLEEAPEAVSMIEGRVYDSSTKKPLMGVMVMVTDDESGKSLMDMTTAGGYWNLDVPAGYFMVTATLDGYKDHSGTITIREDETVMYETIHLVSIPVKSLVLRGQVTSAAMGVPGATVKVMDGSAGIAEATTNGTGHYSVMVYSGTFDLKVTASGYFDKTVSNVAVTANKTLDITLVTIPAMNHELDGVVSGMNGQTIVTDVSVMFLDSDPTHGGYMVIATVFEGGYYRADLYGGDFVRVVDAPGFQASVQQVTVNANKTVDIELDEEGAEASEQTYTFMDSWENVTMTSVMTMVNDVELFKWQLDAEFGDGDLIVEAGEIAAWEAFEVSKGAPSTDTEGKFLVDDVFYMVDEATLGVKTMDLNTSVSDKREFTVTMTANLTVAVGLENATAREISVKVDFDTAMMKNAVNVVLPEGFEMRNNSADKVDVDGTSIIMLDPPAGDGFEMVMLNVTGNLAPVADAGNDRFVKEDVNLTFDAGDSTDDFGIVSYAWDFGDGSPIETNESAVHGFSIDAAHADDAWQIYAVKLTVTDTAGLTDMDTVNVTVDGGSPTAAFKVFTDEDDGTEATAPISIDERNGDMDHDNVTYLFFNASGSKDDVPGATLNYTWDFGDGTPMKHEMAVNHSWNEPRLKMIREGTTVVNREIEPYNVTLNISDRAGYFAEKTVQVTVKDATDPRADISSNASGTVHVGDVIEYNGTGSTDKVWVAGYAWRVLKVVDDVETEVFTTTGDAFDYTFMSEGDYVIELTATDAAGNSNVTTMDQAVTEKAMLPDLEPKSIKLSNDAPRDGDEVEIKVTIENHGPGDAEGYSVRFSVGSKEIETLRGIDIANGEEKTLKVKWKATEGKHKITVEVNPENRPEADTNNNRVSKTVNVEWGLQKLLIPIAVIALIVVIIVGLALRSRASKAAERERRRRRKK